MSMTETIEAVRFEDDGAIPNSPLPLIVHRSALEPARTTPEALEALFEANGWPPAWRAQIFTFHHYHSTSHETLGVAKGEAWVMLGGEGGQPFDIRTGDVVIIPAGVGHKRLSSTADFMVVGAYPPGMSWDLLRGEPGDRPRADRNIARVPLPASDPVTGTSGGLMELWR